MFVYLHTHRWIKRWIIFSKWTRNKYMGKLILFWIHDQKLSYDSKTVCCCRRLRWSAYQVESHFGLQADEVTVWWYAPSNLTLTYLLPLWVYIYTPEEIIRLLSIHDLFSIATATTSPFLGRIWICCIFSYLLSSYLPSMFIPIYIFLK